MKKKIQDNIPRGKTGMAAGAGAVGVAAARGGSNALVAANGVMGGHAMKAMVETVGARNTAMVLSKTGGASSATVILPIGLLGYQFACDVKRYWKGDIDGKELAETTTKNVAAMGAGCVGGYGGAVVGAEVGLVGGPVGAVVGGVVGAVVGGVAGAIIGDSICSTALDSLLGGGTCEKRATLRKAYRQLGLEEGTPNDVVRAKYLRLSKANHPDKGGNKKEFVKINAAYEIIRASQNMKNTR
jgi:hypothetical protein